MRVAKGTQLQYMDEISFKMVGEYFISTHFYRYSLK